MPRTPFAYRLLARLAVPLVPLVLRDPRQQAAHRARLVAPERLREWATLHRDRDRPLVWVHASSVGEGLQARAVIDALLAARPDIQLLYTHYSPSAEQFALSVTANWTGYLGYDRPADVAAMLDAVTPDVLVFTKLDLWPELATQAAARGTRVLLVAATVSPQSGRLRWPTRALTRSGYEALVKIAAISAADAQRVMRLGAFPDRMTVVGDPRVDSVLRARGEVANETSPTSGLDPARTLVAGSTWPEDEAVIFAAFARVRATHRDAALIIAPHQPTPGHLTATENAAAHAGLPQPVRFTTMEPGTMASLVLVDQLGILAQLYSGGMAAYVGGGWGTKGIHSVLEPAAWSVPVVIGPNDRGSRDAALLDEAGGLVRLSAAHGIDDLVRHWSAWLSDAATARVQGGRSRAALEPERGAAVRNADVIAAVIG